MDAPAFPTSKGTRRDRNNISRRVIGRAIKHANASRVQRDQPPILIAVTPHTFRRTYITFMLAAGFDLPYVQDQVGHTDPITTMGIYARVIRRADRDTVRTELRELFGDNEQALGPRPIASDLSSQRRELERSEQRGVER